MANCPECRTHFTRKRFDQAYCSADCNREASKRELKRARVVYRALYHWRLHRKHSGRNLVFLCREIAAWIHEDRMHQKGPPPAHDFTRDAGVQAKRDPASEFQMVAPH